MQGGGWRPWGLAMGRLLQDLRYAYRQLRHAPGFALTAILTLALGIGANVVVFSVLNSLVLQPMHFAHPEQVYNVQRTNNAYGVESYPNYKDFRDRNSTFSALAMYRMTQLGLETSGSTQPVWGDEVSGNYFSMLGAQPYLGRLIEPQDDQIGGNARYVVLSYAAWRGKLGGDRNVVGRTVRLNKIPYVVLGVAQKGFQGTERWYTPDFWVPVAGEPALDGYDWLNARDNENLAMIGRLKPGVTPAAAAANLNAVAAQLAREHPHNDGDLAERMARPGFMGNTLGGPVKAFLLGVTLLAGLVLLAACANLGSLFSARIADRTRELAIRIAVGAGRGRIVRQLLTEAVTVSVAGGAAGLGLALLLLQALNHAPSMSSFPGQILVYPDGYVYGFAVIVSVAAGMLFGSVPARQIWRTDPNAAIKGGSDALPSARWAFRDALLAVQIAICCLLVTASLVALRGMERTLHAKFGFRPRGVLVATMDLRLDGYSDDTAAPVQKRLLEAVSHLPGVTAAAYANTIPLSVNESFTGIYRADETDFSVPKEAFSAAYYEVSPGYFRTAGTQLLAGRELTWQDDAQAPTVAIVNQSFARKMFGTQNAVGRYFRRGPKEQIEIVGVVEDGKYITVSEEPRQAIFLSILQRKNTGTMLLVRSAGSAAAIAPEVREAIRRVDAGLPVSGLDSWREELSAVLLPSYAATTALGVFGVLGVLLSMTGIFGLASFSVSRRMKELGIRVALGATHRQVLQAALRRPAMLLTCGSVAGLALGVAAARLLAAIVYEATPNDPVVLFGVAFTMLLTGVAATLGPAMRVVRADPARVLREQ